MAGRALPEHLPTPSHGREVGGCERCAYEVELFALPTRMRQSIARPFGGILAAMLTRLGFRDNKRRRRNSGTDPAGGHGRPMRGQFTAPTNSAMDCRTTGRLHGGQHCDRGALPNTSDSVGTTHITRRPCDNAYVHTTMPFRRHRPQESCYCD